MATKKKLASEVKVGDVVVLKKYCRVCDIKKEKFGPASFLDDHHGFTFKFDDHEEEFFTLDNYVKIYYNKHK
ncbi:MAG: hypothetical protein OXB92_17345 [Acidimicrobiaceae bacterium]|nr:hypothetical protein [Acidimicrobiaceae bacterium]